MFQKSLFFVFINGLVLLGCSDGNHTIKTCYINLIDAPAEINVYLQKNLYKPDHYVLLDYSGKIVVRSEKGTNKIEEDAPFVFFRHYDAENAHNSGTDNYRYDVKFLYDSLGMLDKMNVHIERYEHDYWHSYANPGIFNLQLDEKQSRLKPKQQQKAVLEKISNTLKKLAFK